MHLAYSEDDERPLSTYGTNSDPDLGCIDCEGNEYNHNSKPNALVSCWGAIGDLDWIDVENDIPTIMFHGNLDPIVPFNSGFPFTIDIALPIVYGSNLIYGRFNELGFENELHVGEGELHEYWGALNGNWFTGPNDNFNQITSEAFNFLYDQLQLNGIGDLNFDGSLDVLDIVIMVNLILNEEYIENADVNNDSFINVLDIILLLDLIIIEENN